MIALKNKRILTKCMEMVVHSGVCPKTVPSEWVRVLLYAHTKGYLFTNADATTFVCAYRIPYWDEKFSRKMPVKDYGNKLFVSFVVSTDDDPKRLLRMLRNYLFLNQDIAEIIYYRRNNPNDLRIFKARRISYGK